MKTGSDPLAFLKAIGSIEEIRQAAQKNLKPSPVPAFNTHIHLPPNFSAFETVEQAVAMAASQRVRVLGAGNYYDFTVYREFSERAQRRGIFPLFGTEIIALETDLQRQGIKVNDPGNPGKYYICGKGISQIDQISPKAAELIGTIRRNDAERMRQMIAKMDEVFRQAGVETGLDDQAVIARVVRRHGAAAETVTLQERHVCQAFQEIFFEKVAEEDRTAKLTELFGAAPKSDPSDAVGIQNEIRSHLMKAGKPCFVPETFVNLKQARELICELGGIPCYPTLADGAAPICRYESPVEDFVKTLKDNGCTMAEFIPVRNSPEVLADYAAAMRKAGIVLVAGTEHNTLDLIGLEPVCTKGRPIPHEVRELFWEGTCVLAAHQFLRAHGACGFVDAAGRPNPDYANTEDRIADFKRIGEAVIATYFETAAKESK